MVQNGGLSHLSYQKLAQFVNRGSGMTTKLTNSENAEKEKSPVIRKREKRESELLTQARLKELLHYDPITGVFTRLSAPNNKFKIGSIAGSRNKDGYIHMKVDGARFRAHRLAFLYMEGYFPEHQVDHIDRNPSNNIWSNLRHVGKSCNMLNRDVLSSNKTGVSGVAWHNRDLVFNVKVAYEGIQRHLGSYHDFVDAVAARLAAEQCLEFPYCNSTSSAFLYMQTYLKDLANK